MPDIILQTQHLSKRYGSLVAVKDLNLEVYAGEIFGFLGPNGAGKTTSINMICGLLKPDAGRVTLQGAAVSNGDAEIRRRVGVCPQNIVLWERLTSFEQLVFIGEMYGMKTVEARRRSQQLLIDLDLIEKRNQQARTLSGGMQRRLNLAMALVHDPAILILDEPEAGLDPQSRVKVRTYIQSLARKKTIILTTHNMDEAERLADRVAVIDRGELMVIDTPEALKRRVGEGDIIEVQVNGNIADVPALRIILKPYSNEVVYDEAGHLLRIRALDAVGRLSPILTAIDNCGIQAGEVGIHPNTLEDVFIQLTGRRLRE